MYDHISFKRTGNEGFVYSWLVYFLAQLTGTAAVSPKCSLIDMAHAKFLG